MMEQKSRSDRADDITAAIIRFQQNKTIGEHDGRLIAENLATEAGFNGTPNSRRTQLQHYFTAFPGLRLRWNAVKQGAKAASGQPTRDYVAELKKARMEIARLREELKVTYRVSDLRRRKAERLERQLNQQRVPSPRPNNVVDLHPARDSPQGT
ncbi:hypothetical protein [Streptomyces sp. NPDC000994]